MRSSKAPRSWPSATRFTATSARSRGRSNKAISTITQSHGSTLRRRRMFISSTATRRRPGSASQVCRRSRRQSATRSMLRPASVSVLCRSTPRSSNPPKVKNRLIGRNSEPRSGFFSDEGRPRMGIVRFALRYPHTFYVVAALILFLGVTAAVEMPTDIFPEINIPVVSVIWQYTGLDTTEMEQRVTTYSQYSISSNVNGIRDIEAETVNGISVQKIYFQPDVNLDLAISQIVAATNSIRAVMPTGIQPPVVVQYSASAVPVLKISLGSDSLSESQLYDYGIYRLRQMIAPIHGVTLPTPSGGKYREIMVDIDQTKLLAHGLTPLQAVNAVNTQNLTLPGGTAKF